MKPHLRQCLIILACLFFCLPHHAQDNPAADKLQAYARHFSAFAKDYPQEKVYLHFDNTSYYLGETIWFKAYVVRADAHLLSNFSGVLYVELVTPAGNIIDTRKLKIESGQCHGDFRLPVTQYAGFFEIRAYTRYMLNFGEDNYFSRVFPVYDEPKKEGKFENIITERPPSQRIPQKRPEYEQKGKLAVNFYPEGGNLVRGIPSRVAFKATSSEGENAIVSGGVYNEQNEKVTDFSTQYNGMGVFTMCADSGRYTARVSYNNRDYSFTLPAALPAGYAINVDNMDDNKVNISIQRSDNLTVPDSLALAISCRGILYGFEKVVCTTQDMLSFSFPKTMLPSGVSQITLVGADGRVLCERMIFINHNSQIKISCSQNKTEYQPFEKVEVNFELKSKAGKAVETSFSVAVRDNSTCPAQPYADNILINLLLSSDLKGYIENPAYYFEKDDMHHRYALDLLLLVQGWSRYSWRQTTGIDKFKIKQPIEKQLFIEGTVTTLLTKKKAKDTEVSMILLADSTSQNGKCPTDKDGTFGFALQDFQGNAKLILQTKQNGKKKENNIQLDRNFSPDLRAYLYPETHVQKYELTVRDSTISKPEDDIASQNTNEDPELHADKNLPMDKRNHLLKTVSVEEKRINRLKPSLQYQVSHEMDKIKDLGDWQPGGINELFGKLNDYFIYGDELGPRYKGIKKVLFLRDNSMSVTGDISDILSDNMESSATPTMNAGGVAVVSNNQTTNVALQQKEGFPPLDEIESISVIENINDMLRICPALINENNYTNTVIVLLHCKKNYHKEPYGTRETTFAGFSYTKEFYSPNYDKVVLPDEKDHRRTLYWNPNVRTDEDGNATISFFNNGSCKAMNVSAETVTANGVIGVLNK